MQWLITRVICLSLQMSVGVWLTCSYKLDIVLIIGERESGKEWETSFFCLCVQYGWKRVCVCVAEYSMCVRDRQRLRATLSAFCILFQTPCVPGAMRYLSNRHSGLEEQFPVIWQGSPLCVSSEVRLSASTCIWGRTTRNVGGGMMRAVDCAFWWIS